MFDPAGSGVGRRHSAPCAVILDRAQISVKRVGATAAVRAAELQRNPPGQAPTPAADERSSPHPGGGRARVSEEEVILEEAAVWLGGHLSSCPPNKRRLDGPWHRRRRSMGRREGRLSRHRPSTREARPPTSHPRPSS